MFFAVSCLAISPAVNPPPQMTTVRCFNLLAMRGSSAEVGDRFWILRARVWLAPKFHHVLSVGRRQTGITDHLPKHLADVTAVDRIGEASLDEQRIDEFVEPRTER